MGFCICGLLSVILLNNTSDTISWLTRYVSLRFDLKIAEWSFYTKTIHSLSKSPQYRDLNMLKEWTSSYFSETRKRKTSAGPENLKSVCVNTEVNVKIHVIARENI